jgi:hypothetical protein
MSSAVSVETMWGSHSDNPMADQCSFTLSAKASSLDLHATIFCLNYEIRRLRHPHEELNLRLIRDKSAQRRSNAAFVSNL